MEMIKATVNDCFENVSLRDKINIWITRPGRGNFLPWACLSFPTTELKYSYENFVKEKINRIAAYRSNKSTSNVIDDLFLYSKAHILDKCQPA